ncbi:MAG TPA: cysteine--tRNA ligase [Thermomicrobiaceae bacterium]|nr:cysteine--tRNA ligase [Thermomicrobiaceae bacterium]
MRLYNTLTGRDEEFTPLDGQTVRMYVCGITPYDTTHMGHAMTYLTFDVINRYCQYLGWRVKYVQNVTDIDDDIIRKARELGESWDRLGDRCIRQFQEDLNGLNVLPPAVYPRATEEIPGIVDMVESLVEQGMAYPVEGNVYFRTASDPDYGHLSRCDVPGMIELSAQRGANPEDPRKENPLDFILWQAMQPGEPHWPSPWGPGRPGWHIECSAMSMRYLGPQVDIHGGGSDLVYPHHESEIAQSEGFTHETPFAHFWVHTAMVRYQGEKMSKSLGNLVLVRDVLRDHTPDALRLYLHSHHYRETWEYEDDGPARFEPTVDLLRRAVRARGGNGMSLNLEPLLHDFFAAIDNDLDTPTAVGVLREMAYRLSEAAEQGQDVEDARAMLRRAASIFGLHSTR